MQFSVTSTTGISTAGSSSAVKESANTSQSVAQSGSVSPFSNLLSNAIGQIDQLEDQARIAAERMMTGSGVDVHQAMIATQKASMAFELALSVRNKAVQAYQSVMGMQF